MSVSSGSIIKSRRDSLPAPGSVFFCVLCWQGPQTTDSEHLAPGSADMASVQEGHRLSFVAVLFGGDLLGEVCIDCWFVGLGLTWVQDMKPFTVDALSVAMTLFTGFGYIVGIPLSTALGRRPVVLAASAITTGATLWAGVAGSFYQLLFSLCLQALATGAAIGMFILIIIDATYIHERPNALSLYWCVGSVFIKLAILLFPITTDLTNNWRQMYLVWFAFAVSAFVLILLFVPETFFLRPPVALDGRVLVQSGSEKVEVYEAWEEIELVNSERPLPDLPRGRMWNRIWGRISIKRAPGTEWKAWVATYMQMALCIVNPLTFWVSLLTGVILSGVISIFLTQPGALIGLWHQDPQHVSIMLGVMGIIGSILAFPATGPLACWFTRRQSLRTAGGIRHAELYLPIFALPVVSGLLSLIINGLAIKNQWHPACLYIVSVLSIFSYLTGNVAFTLWITEAFPRWAAAALAVQLFTGNMVSFGIGTAIMPWCSKQDIVPPTLIIGGLMLVLGVLAVPAAFWGQTVRQYIHGRWSDSEKGALRPQ
ncbi:hypothetical protein NM208_g10460 [Fusarium decemcellulare]|uniref:Uncharacterized protein n=1 Tax=Fusarium decemcellulare TaxID=57161 RepID=A0ACC1RXS8_9HYPO|nr:hypothetical protein NM208_g10460 [Fusarium decemcellulare]